LYGESVEVAHGTKAGNPMANQGHSDHQDIKSPRRPDLNQAFTELRPAMFALAYRITGNRADSEEIVQDAFLRLHNAAPKDAVHSLKSYLATITARLSLNRLRDQRARRETYVGEWLPEPLSTDHQPAVRAEEVSFALVAVLERLSPLERVVFVLRNAFDLDFKDISAVVSRDVVTCRKLFSRARARILEERPRFVVDRERHRELLRTFAEAARSGDTEKLISLLENDAVLHGDGGGRALASKKPILGKAAIAQFIVAVSRAAPIDPDLQEMELNGAPGLVLKRNGSPVICVLIETNGQRIHSVFAVANPDKLRAIN
jgi:RNA polymerase sigma-70 factor, ECF subfamily